MSIRKNRSRRAYSEVVKLEERIRDAKRKGKTEDAERLESEQERAYRRMSKAMKLEQAVEARELAKRKYNGNQ